MKTKTTTKITHAKPTTFTPPTTPAPTPAPARPQPSLTTPPSPLGGSTAAPLNPQGRMVHDGKATTALLNTLRPSGPETPAQEAARLARRHAIATHKAGR